ncbi:hypothetical protein HRbin20_01633 [bacterium HR20]|nr:hypothetical protein HRbin20_01633 [bacterium HR20]
MCLVLDSTYPPPFSEVWWPDPEDTAVRRLIFSAEYLWEDFCCAARAWSCICGWENQTCQCRVRVKFSIHSTDFPVGSRVTAYAIPWWWRPQGDSRFALCDSFEIRLNSTPWYVGTNRDWQYIGLDEMGMPRRFFYNRRFWEAAWKIDTSTRLKKYYAYDLCTILTHEIGHIYGFGDGSCSAPVCDTCFQDANFRRDHPERCRCCYEGIMNGRGFTEHDRCMFAKLYCPELASVRIDQTAPREAEGQRLQLKIPSGGALIRLQIYDLRGRLLEEIPAQWYSGGDATIEVPTHGVSGVYFCVVEVNGERCLRTIIVP